MNTKRVLKMKRQLRIRAKISGTTKRPRLRYYRSNMVTYAQVIDDEKHVTILARSTKGKNQTTARALGKEVAEAAKKHKITAVVFDRGGFRYHGRVKEFADAAREGGLQF